MGIILTNIAFQRQFIGLYILWWTYDKYKDVFLLLGWPLDRHWTLWKGPDTGPHRTRLDMSHVRRSASCYFNSPKDQILQSICLHLNFVTFCFDISLRRPFSALSATWGWLLRAKGRTDWLNLEVWWSCVGISYKNSLNWYVVIMHTRRGQEDWRSLTYIPSRCTSSYAHRRWAHPVNIWSISAGQYQIQWYMSANWWPISSI